MKSEDEEAFHRLVDARGVALSRTAYLLTGNWHAAEDLVQSALATTWARWRSLRDPQAAEAYARRCMARTSASWWRSVLRRETVFDTVPEEMTTGAYDNVELSLVVTRALGLLTPRQRAMLVLRFFDDLGEAQVAEAMGCSLGTVKSTVARALARLQAADVWEGVAVGASRRAG